LIKREVFFAKLVNQFIVLNITVYKMLKQFINVSKINIIYDGVDLGQDIRIPKGSFRRELNLDFQSLVGIAGRFIEGKGHKEFILAAKEVNKISPDVKFVVIGDNKGGDEKYFIEAKELARSKGLSGTIIFTGWRNNLSEVMQDVDIVAQPYTRPEGLPNTIIEAMALAKPVISTNIPGPSEIVVNDETGFLVPAGDINVLAERIIYLLKNPDIAKKMGEKGRKRVEEVFDIRKTVKQIETLCGQVLN